MFAGIGAGFILMMPPPLDKVRNGLMGQVNVAMRLKKRWFHDPGALASARHVDSKPQGAGFPA